MRTSKKQYFKENYKSLGIGAHFLLSILKEVAIWFSTIGQKERKTSKKKSNKIIKRMQQYLPLEMAKPIEGRWTTKMEKVLEEVKERK